MKDVNKISGTEITTNIETLKKMFRTVLQLYICYILLTILGCSSSNINNNKELQGTSTSKSKEFQGWNNLNAFGQSGEGIDDSTAYSNAVENLESDFKANLPNLIKLYSEVTGLDQEIDKTLSTQLANALSKLNFKDIPALGKGESLKGQKLAIIQLDSGTLIRLVQDSENIDQGIKNFIITNTPNVFKELQRRLNK